MKSKLLIFILMLALAPVLLAKSVFAAEEGFIIKYSLADKAGKSLFVGGENKNDKISLKTEKLTAPFRLVADIEHATLKDENGKRTISVDNKILTEKVRMAQFSTDPNIVRLVFTVDSAESLDKIQVTTRKNSILFAFDGIKPDKTYLTSVFRSRNDESLAKAEKIEIKADSSDKEGILREIKEKVNNNIVLTSIQGYGNRVLVSGAGIISVVEPFILDSPGRVIFDLADAVLDSPDLIGSFSLKNNDTVRIAQFNPRTVRMVIESSTPKQYKYLLSPDLQSVIISPQDSLSFEEFLDSAARGEFQDIKIAKVNDTVTKLVITSKTPIIHSIERYYAPDRLHLNLFNIEKPAEETIKSLEKTPQFHGFNLEPGKNTVLALPVSNSTVIRTKLGLDGRMLEIALDDALSAPLKAPSKLTGKIIIDPGHGGYDPGAQRNGIYEKDIVLDVSRRIKKYLDEQGFYVIMTRESDKTLSLKERVALTEREKPDIFLSVHANASHNPDIKGLETHWYTLKSRPLAMHVQNQMVNRLVTPDRGLKNSRFFVIRNSQIPAVLAEIGYMSNETELYQLMTEERRESTAKAIADGIINYFKSQNNNTEPEGRKKL